MTGCIDAAQHYERLLTQHSALAEALCWVVVLPQTGVLTLDEVVARLGERTARIEQLPVGARWAHYPAEVVHIGIVGSNVMLLEVNGLCTTRQSTVRRLSIGGRAVAVHWNVNHANRLRYAVHGVVRTELDAMTPDQRWGYLPEALDEWLAPLCDAAAGTAEFRWQAAAMAVVEASTGIRLEDGWLAGTHPSAVIG